MKGPVNANEKFPCCYVFAQGVIVKKAETAIARKWLQTTAVARQ
jgi:hypothetical protein